MEPISTPISYSISKYFSKKIRNNKYVDFATLLPQAAGQTLTFAFLLNAKDQLNLAPAHHSKKIVNIDTWTTAFLRFVAIYSSYTILMKLPNL
jgi:hypothetical protein